MEDMKVFVNLNLCVFVVVSKTYFIMIKFLHCHIIVEMIYNDVIFISSVALKFSIIENKTIYYLKSFIYNTSI